MRYFAVVFVMSLFVIAYVWQNIEVMKIKMEYRRLVREEKVLIEKNARLKSEFEKMRSFQSIEARAGRMNLVRISPESALVVKTDDANGINNEKNK